MKQRIPLCLLVLLTLGLPAFAQDLTVWKHPDLPSSETTFSATSSPPEPLTPPEPPPETLSIPEWPTPVETPSSDLPAAFEAALSAEQFFGTTPVIDVAHIGKTLEVIKNAIEQVKRLEALKKKADIDLSNLLRIPFVDSENHTGAFLAKMLWILGGGHPNQNVIEEETLAYSSHDIADAFRRYFPGERILPDHGAGPSPWEIWDNEADYLTDRYRAVLAALYRTMDIYALHTQQSSRERQGISNQRSKAPSASGASQHAQFLLAALHQSLDAESVDRQLRMLDANTRLLLAAEELNDRAAALTKDRAYIEGQRELFASWQPVTEVDGVSLSK